MSTLSISTSDILAHRAGRQAAGLLGCKDGSDMPLGSLRGISWRPADPLDPHCFCFDCRGTWDADGTIDLQLLEKGHMGAVDTYASLLPPTMRMATEERTAAPSVFTPAMMMTGSSPGLSNIPTSLPPVSTTRTFENCIFSTITHLIGEVQSEQIRAMDMKRHAIMTDDPVKKQHIIDVSNAQEDFCQQTIAHLQQIAAQFRANHAMWD
jgi:hypothetical protein